MKACVDTEWLHDTAPDVAGHPRRTSIMTIPKEKMSARLLYAPQLLFRISGAVHRVAGPRSSGSLPEGPRP